MSRLFLLVVLITMSTTTLASSAKCAYERSRLKSIQNAMRTIYNSQNIIDEEQKRYANYRNCMENVSNKNRKGFDSYANNGSKKRKTNSKYQDSKRDFGKSASSHQMGQPSRGAASTPTRKSRKRVVTSNGKRSKPRK